MGVRTERSHVIEPLVDLTEFPASRHSTYLNTASVNLMYREAESATVGWFRDLPEWGTTQRAPSTRSMPCPSGGASCAPGPFGSATAGRRPKRKHPTTQLPPDDEQDRETAP
jgi:hypothetical protein